MIEKTDRINTPIYLSFFIAVLSGVYAQDVSYYLHRSMEIPLLMSLITMTLISLLLFITPHAIIYKHSKKHNIKSKIFNMYFTINALIGVLVSTFAIFVVIAWFA